MKTQTFTNLLDKMVLDKNYTTILLKKITKLVINTIVRTHFFFCIN